MTWLIAADAAQKAAYAARRVDALIEHVEKRDGASVTPPPPPDIPAADADQPDAVDSFSDFGFVIWFIVAAFLGFVIAERVLS